MSISTQEHILTNTKQEAKGREAYFDNVRGIMILAVVGIHASNNGLLFGEKSYSDLNFLYTLVIKQALICAVPIFYMLSGYFSPVARGKEANIIKRLQRILIPYLIWCLAALVIYHPTISNSIYFILSGKVLAPHYFLLPLVFFVFLDRLFYELMQRPLFLGCAIGITIIHILISYGVHIRNPDMNWYQFMVWPSAWIGYYALGIQLRQRGPLLSRNVSIAVALIAFLLSIAEAIILVKALGLRSGAFEPVKLSSFLYSFALCNIIISYNGAQISNSWLSRIGLSSFGIFLMHELVRPRISTVLEKVDILYNIQPVYQLLTVMLTIAICIALAGLCNFILKKRSSSLLGF